VELGTDLKPEEGSGTGGCDVNFDIAVKRRVQLTTDESRKL